MVFEQKMRVLHVASECAPFAVVGGLGDVIGALPKMQALHDQCDVSIVLPYYKPILDDSSLTQSITSLNRYFSVSFLGKDYECSLYQTHLPGSNVQVFLIRNERWLSNGNIYLSTSAFAESNEEILRFLFFSKAVSVALDTRILQCDVLHIHDYHSSYLAQLQYKNGNRIKVVLTIHNLANQGILRGDDAGLLFGEDHTNILSKGIIYADAIVPVSVKYAEEILTPEYGEGLQDLLLEHKGKIRGITNGIDTDVYDPENDAFLNYSFSSGNALEVKKKLISELKVEAPSLGISDTTMVVGVVSRLTSQKNIELMVHALSSIGDEDMVFVVLGVGDQHLQRLLKELQNMHPEKVFFRNSFDTALAHLIYGASHLFLVPSRFEPCGLTQLIAMRYGSIPVVRNVGGLGETVSHMHNGFVFEKNDSNELKDMILEAYAIFRNDKKQWQMLIEHAMNTDYSWKVSAKKYIDLYAKLMSRG